MVAGRKAGITMGAAKPPLQAGLGCAARRLPIRRATLADRPGPGSDLKRPGAGPGAAGWWRHRIIH